MVSERPGTLRLPAQLGCQATAPQRPARPTGAGRPRRALAPTASASDSMHKHSVMTIGEALYGG